MKSPVTESMLRKCLDTVEAIRAGRNVGTVYEGRKRFDLVARFPDAVGKRS